MTIAEEQMSSDLMSPAEVARYLGLAESTIYERMRAGEIPGAIRIGRRWRVSRIAFMRALHGEEGRS